LTKKQIENSPPLNSDTPVSRQYEEAYYGYYGWSKYWSGPNMWGAYHYIDINTSQLPKVKWGPKKPDAHLRSTHDVKGHSIKAKDGEIGHVDDFIIDDKTWEIQYMVINTTIWWPGKKVLVSPHWIESISWDKSEVLVDVLLEVIKRAPEYTDEMLLTDGYETEIYNHYKSEGMNR